MSNTNLADGPLTGFRILDLTSVIMGPFATRILADMGADVIKVESPEGDSVRHYQPQRSHGMSGNTLNLQRNKRSIVLDLKRPECREALNRLIRTADVFVHSVRPQAIERLGFGYEQVRALKPDIVYCGAYGFSAKGPYSDKAAYDDLIQAGSGVAGLFAQLHGEPSYVPTVICDKLTGQAIAYAILAALLHRERGGGGQSIEVPMLETTVDFNFVEHMGGFGFEPPLGEPGFPRLMDRSRKPYRTRDGYACILPYSDRNWQDFYRFTGRTEFQDDARFARLPERVKHIRVLYQMLEEEAAKRTHRRVGGLLRPRQHSVHARAAALRPAGRSAPETGRAVRDRRAPDRGALSLAALSGILQRRAVPRPPARAPDGAEHGGGAGGSRLLRGRDRAAHYAGQAFTLTPALSRQGRGSLESPLPRGRG